MWVDSSSALPTESYNDFYDNSVYHLYKEGTGNITLAGSDITSNPLLTGYILDVNSPCKNTGANLADVTSDIRYVPRPFGEFYDRGAYEFINPLQFSWIASQDEDTAKYRIYVNDESLMDVSGKETTSWTGQANLVEGSNHIEITAIDASGNESVRSDPFYFFLDAAIPGAPGGLNSTLLP
jgi:hypothetical protein